MRIHYLKTWPVFFSFLYTGLKKFEVRDNSDRNFQVGDSVVLIEWDPDTKKPTGRSLSVIITYILDDFPGLSPGYVAFSFNKLFND